LRDIFSDFRELDSEAEEGRLEEPEEEEDDEGDEKKEEGEEEEEGKLDASFTETDVEFALFSSSRLLFCIGSDWQACRSLPFPKISGLLSGLLGEVRFIRSGGGDWVSGSLRPNERGRTGDCGRPSFIMS